MSSSLPICDDVPECAVTMEIEESQTVAKKEIFASSDIPDYLEGWEDDFEIPKYFGNDTVMTQLKNGIITDSVKNHVSQEVVRHMLNHCRYPSSRQFNVVAARLVETYKNLKDCDGTGSESWSNKLRICFYNIRRRPKLQSMGLEIKSKPPKRPKTSNDHHNIKIPSTSSYNDQDKSIYERNKTTMKNIKPPERSSKTGQFLMKETLPLRQQWIQEDFPIVKEILTEFPLLESYTNLISEFKSLTKMDQDPEIRFSLKWEEWQPKIIQYAKINNAGKSNSTTSNLLAASMMEIPSDQMVPVGICLLSSLIDKRFVKVNHEAIFKKLENGTCISNKETLKTPYIGILGEDITKVSSFTIIVERQAVVTVNNFRKAILALMACYYTFNIQYPKEVTNTLLFIERYLLGVTTGPRISTSALQTVSAITKL